MVLLLSNPDQVQRRDVSKVIIQSHNGVLAELRALARVWARPHTLLLTIVLYNANGVVPSLGRTWQIVSP